MATSGSYNWTQSRDEIIEDAFESIGVLAVGQTASAALINEGSKVLNRMVKGWQTRGVRLWSIEKAQQTITAPSSVVTNGGITYTCIEPHTSGDDLDEPGAGKNWTTYWKLTGTGGSACLTATAYTAIGVFTFGADMVGIERAFIRDTDHKDIPLELINRQEYADISNKTTVGKPSQLHVETKLDGSTVGHIYPIPDDSTDVLHYDRVRLLEDFDNSADNADLPVRWLQAIHKGLCSELAPKYGLPLQERQVLKQEAEYEFAVAKGSDNETEEEFSIAPDMRY